jgi:hypothetical protein
MTDVLKLPEALAAWGTPDFIPTLKREIETLNTLRWVLAKRMNGFGSIDAVVRTATHGWKTKVQSANYIHASARLKPQPVPATAQFCPTPCRFRVLLFPCRNATGG